MHIAEYRLIAVLPVENEETSTFAIDAHKVEDLIVDIATNLVLGEYEPFIRG